MRLDTSNNSQSSPFNTERSTPGTLQAAAALSGRKFIQEMIAIGRLGAVYKAQDLGFPSISKADGGRAMPRGTGANGQTAAWTAWSTARANRAGNIALAARLQPHRRYIQIQST